MGDINISELEQFETEELDSAHALEVFFSDGETSEDDDGLIWKDILREGEWAFRPGLGGKPMPVPLKVVSGKASNVGKEIGMADLQEAFEDEAIDHVTIPTSHEDKPHENTGYIKALKTVNRNGKKVLQAGMHFTEPEIKAKAIRGSIANTSAGIIFDYIKKDVGKKYSQVLGHVALTNKPWINGMKPFGVTASENFSDDEIIPLMLENVVWDNNRSFNFLKDKISEALKEDDKPSHSVLDVMPNRALVTKLSNPNESFVVPFQVKNGTVQLSNNDNWIQASNTWVNTSKSFSTDFDSNRLSDDLSEEAPHRGANESDPQTGGNNMGIQTTEKVTEETPGAPSDNPAPVGLSEEQVSELIEKAKEDSEIKFSETAKENEELRSKVHKMEVGEKIEELKALGFSSQPGLLAEIRNILLASDGKPALVLSEQSEGEETKEVSLSVQGIVERIVNSMPKSEDGKVDFGEMALSVENHNRPVETTEELSEEDRTRKAAEELGLEDKTSTEDGE